jgi:hypothetical protein
MVSIAGEQQLNLDPHDSGNRRDWGGHVALSSDNLLIYLHDQVAARMYANAWIDAWYIASKLPRPPTRGRRHVTMVRARGSDAVDHVLCYPRSGTCGHSVGDGTLRVDVSPR